MQKKILTSIGIVSISILIIFSICFYKERTVFLDAAFHLFCFAKDKNFAIQNYRFGAFASQILPVIELKFGLPLKFVAVSYSLSFLLLYASTFFLIRFSFKNLNLSIAYLIFLLAITTHTFYWIQSELPQGVAFLFLIMALYEKVKISGKKTFLLYLITMALVILLCFTHPLLLFALFFMVAYYFLETKNRNTKFLLFILFTYIIALIVKSIFFKTPYDAQSLNGLKNIITYFPHYLNLESNRKLAHYFLAEYAFVPIILLIETIYFLLKKEYLKIGLILIFFIGYTFMVNISYPNGDNQFYLENQYLVIAIFLGIPLALDVLPSIRPVWIYPTIIFLIASVGLIRIFNTQAIYLNRLQWVENYLYKTDKLQQKKIILSQKIVPMNTLIMTWGSSFEFWLISTINNHQTRSIIIEENNTEFDKDLPAKSSFITKWGAIPYKDLDRKYFILTDTSAYQKIEE